MMAILVLQGCKKNRHKDLFYDIKISASIGNLSKVATNNDGSQYFENNDEISVYAWVGDKTIAPSAGERVVNNSVNRLNNGVCTASPQMLWNTTTDPHNFIGIYPKTETPVDNLAVDIYRTNENEPALNISKNNEFDGTNVTVESVLLRQTAGAVKLNLQQNGAVSVHGDAQAIDVMMHSLQGGSYEAIFFPYLGQEAGAKMITVNMSNGNSYSYTVPAEGINFEAGCAYTMNLKVGKDKLNLSGVSIGSWEFEESELNGGEAED